MDRDLWALSFLRVLHAVVCTPRAVEFGRCLCLPILFQDGARGGPSSETDSTASFHFIQCPMRPCNCFARRARVHSIIGGLPSLALVDETWRGPLRFLRSPRSLSIFFSMWEVSAGIMLYRVSSRFSETANDRKRTLVVNRPKLSGVRERIPAPELLALKNLSKWVVKNFLRTHKSDLLLPESQRIRGRKCSEFAGGAVCFNTIGGDSITTAQRVLEVISNLSRLADFADRSVFEVRNEVTSPVRSRVNASVSAPSVLRARTKSGRPAASYIAC